MENTMKRSILLTLILVSCTTEEKLAGDSANPFEDTAPTPDTSDNLDTSDTSDTDTSDTSNGNNWEVMAPGDLIITEIQNNPCVLGDDSDGDGNQDCTLSDDLGEWFEIYNNSGLDLELNGLVIRDDDLNNPQQFTINQPTSILSGGYVVFHVNSDQSTNGGISSVIQSSIIYALSVIFILRIIQRIYIKKVALRKQ